MSLYQWLITGGIFAFVILSVAHSLLGERLLLKPMFAQRGNAVLDSDFARLILRFAWHVTSLGWLMMAIILYTVGFAGAALPAIVLLTFGIGFTSIEVFDGIATRGRHIGWWVLTAVGLFCLGAFIVAGPLS